MELMYSMEYLKQNWDRFEDYEGLYAFLLYGSVQKEFVQYINRSKNWNHLHYASKDVLLIFVPQLTEPDLEMEKYRLYSDRGTAVYRDPAVYPDDSVYKIIREFDLRRKDLPALVIFKHVDGEEILQIPLVKDLMDSDITPDRWTQELLKVIDDVADALKTARGKKDVKLEAFKKLEKSYNPTRLRKAIGTILQIINIEVGVDSKRGLYYKVSKK